MKTEARHNLLVEGWGTPWQRTTSCVINEGYPDGSYNTVVSMATKFRDEVDAKEDKFVHGTNEPPSFFEYMDNLVQKLAESSSENETAKQAIDTIENYFPGGFRKNLIYPQTDIESTDMIRWAGTLVALLQKGDAESILKLVENPTVYFLGFDDSNIQKIKELHKKLFKLEAPRNPGDDSDPVLTAISKLSKATSHIDYLVWAIYQGYSKLCNAIKESLNEKL